MVQLINLVNLVAQVAEVLMVNLEELEMKVAIAQLKDILEEEIIHPQHQEAVEQEGLVDKDQLPLTLVQLETEEWEQIHTHLGYQQFHQLCQQIGNQQHLQDILLEEAVVVLMLSILHQLQVVLEAEAVAEQELILD